MLSWSVGPYVAIVWTLLNCHPKYKKENLCAEVGGLGEEGFNSLGLSYETMKYPAKETQIIL